MSGYDETMQRIKDWVKMEKSGLIWLGVIWVVFFGRVLFLNQVYFLGDLKVLFYPLEHVYGEFFATGQLPIWSPTFGFGHPLLSWSQVGFLNPVHLGLRLLGIHSLRVIHISMLVYFAGGLLGMYGLLRKWRVSGAAAVMGAAVFVFSGFNVYHIQHVNFFVAVMLLPGLIYVLFVLIERPSTKRAIMLSVVAATMVLNGHAQIVLYLFVLAGLAGLCLWRKFRWQQVVLIVLAGCLGLGLSALSIFPLQEFLPYIDRNEGVRIDELYNFSYPPWQAATLIWPTVFGDRDSYWGAKSMLELGAFVGIVPILLAGGALVSWRDNKRLRLMGVLLLIISVGLGLGKYSMIYRWLVENHLFPPFTAPGRWSVLGVFAVAVLAAVGWDDIRKMSDQSRRWIWLGGLGMLGIAVGPWLAAGYGSAVNIDIWEWWLSVVGLMAWWGMVWFSKRQKIWQVGTVVMTVVTLIWLGWQTYPMMKWQVATREPLFAEELRDWGEKNGYPPRIYSESELWQREREDMGPEVKKTEELNENFWVRQDFRADRDELNCLKIGLDVKATANNKDEVRLVLRDENRERAARSWLAKDLDRSGEQEWCFDRQQDSAGRNYQLIVKSSGGISLRYDPTINAGMQLVRVKDPTSEQLEQSRKPFSLVMKKWYGSEVDEDQMLLARHLQVTAGAGSARWIGSLSIRRYRDFVRDLFANDGQTVDGDGIHVLNRNRALFDMAGVSHFIQVIREGVEDTMGRHGFRLVAEEVVRGNRYRLYENEQVYPRVWLVYQAERLDSAADVLVKLRELDVDLTEVVLLEGAGNVKKEVQITSHEDAPIEANNEVAEDEVEIVNYDSTEVEIMVRMENAGWLVLADSYLPQWQATIDGEAVEVEAANEVFRAVAVSEGEHQVKFYYKSPAIDMAIKLMTAAAVIGVLGWFMSSDIDKWLGV